MSELANSDRIQKRGWAQPGGNILPALAAYKRLPGMEGATYYWLRERELRRNVD